MHAEREVEVEIDSSMGESCDLLLGDQLVIKMIEHFICVDVFLCEEATSVGLGPPVPGHAVKGRRGPKACVVEDQGIPSFKRFERASVSRYPHERSAVRCVECFVVERRRRWRLSGLPSVSGINKKLVPEEPAHRRVGARLVWKRCQKRQGGHERPAVVARQTHQLVEVGEVSYPIRVAGVQGVDRSEEPPSLRRGWVSKRPRWSPYDQRLVVRATARATARATDRHGQTVISVREETAVAGAW